MQRSIYENFEDSFVRAYKNSQFWQIHNECCTLLDSLRTNLFPIDTHGYNVTFYGTSPCEYYLNMLDVV